MWTNGKWKMVRQGYRWSQTDWGAELKKNGLEGPAVGRVTQMGLFQKATESKTNLNCKEENIREIDEGGGEGRRFSGPQSVVIGTRRLVSNFEQKKKPITEGRRGGHNILSRGH